MSTIRRFIDRHYRHFNAATVREAAEGYAAHLDTGGRMLITLAGAMSTAELGISLAEMIRQGKVHAICCTGANLEEDVFNLVAHDHYHRIPNWRNLTAQEEKDLEARGLNRVTDTCIPEDRAFRAIEREILELWQAADAAGERRFPHEYVYKLVREKLDRSAFQIDPADSWLYAAAERDLPLFVPGWEDSTLGNIFVARVFTGDLSGTHVVRSGTEYMHALAAWYMRTTMGEDLQRAVREAPDADASHGAAVSPDQAETTIGFSRSVAGSRGISPSAWCP